MSSTQAISPFSAQAVQSAFPEPSVAKTSTWVTRAKFLAISMASDLLLWGGGAAAGLSLGNAASGAPGRADLISGLALSANGLTAMVRPLITQKAFQRLLSPEIERGALPADLEARVRCPKHVGMADGLKWIGCTLATTGYGLETVDPGPTPHALLSAGVVAFAGGMLAEVYGVVRPQPIDLSSASSHAIKQVSRLSAQVQAWMGRTPTESQSGDITLSTISVGGAAVVEDLDNTQTQAIHTDAVQTISVQKLLQRRLSSPV